LVAVELVEVDGGLTCVVDGVALLVDVLGAVEVLAGGLADVLAAVLAGALADVLAAVLAGALAAVPVLCVEVLVVSLVPQPASTITPRPAIREGTHGMRERFRMDIVRRRINDI
jgi:hypothetical protein